MAEATFKPTVAEVAALIRARTKIPGGGEAGTFNANTRPTLRRPLAFCKLKA